MTNQLRRNANLVEMLGGALRDGDHALGAAPSLLRQILEEESWREFVTQRGEHVQHERFADFVTTPPLAGLGSDVDLIRRIVAANDGASAALREALKEKPGPKRSRNNVTGSRRGNDRAYILGRLAQERPDLHAEVLAKRLSAHSAAVQAGFRPHTITVRADSPESTADTLRRHMKPDDIATLARLLAGDA